MSDFSSSVYQSFPNASKKNKFRKIEFRPLKTSDDEGEEVELLARGNSLKRRSPTVSSNDPAYNAFSAPTPSAATCTKFFIEHKLQPDDTVTSLSLRYSCSAVDLKRLNGLSADQDLFALKVVKIPVSPFGALAAGNAASSLGTSRGTVATVLENRSDSSSPTEGGDGDSQTDRFFSKIDSKTQESFFWLSKKPLAPITDEADPSNPEVIINTGTGEVVHGEQKSVFTRANPGVAPVESNGVSKLMICLYVAGFLLLFVVVPILGYLHYKSKEVSHQTNATDGASISQNGS